MKKHTFSLSQRVASFKHAFNGLRVLLNEEHNAMIHVGAAVLVILFGLFFRVSPGEWIALIFSIGIVISFEIVNTTIENIADFISPKRDHKIKKIKDLSAAGVLISTVTALAIGLLIFVPKML